MRLFNPRGQNLAEYALVFSLVIAALITMQTYVKRGLQGRYKEATDFVISALQEKTGDSGLALQYEPYYNQSEFTITVSQTIAERENLGGSKESTTIDNTTRREGKQWVLPAQPE